MKILTPRNNKDYFDYLTGIYTSISFLNDKEVIDTRTDIQKAESAGFDRRTSFRNIK